MSSSNATPRPQVKRLKLRVNIENTVLSYVSIVLKSLETQYSTIDMVGCIKELRHISIN